jgi:hypothetical protein
MSFVSGTAGSVAYVSGGTTMVQGAHEWTVTVKQDTPEVTIFGDSFKNYLPGIRSWTASVSLKADPAQPSQDTIRNMILGGSVPIAFRFYAGTNYYSGSAMPNSIAPSVSYDDAWVNKIDMQGVGTLSYT